MSLGEWNRPQRRSRGPSATTRSARSATTPPKRSRGCCAAANAGAHTAADHITVLDAALAQIRDAHLHGQQILIRADTAGCTKPFLAHIRAQREQGVSCEFSVGWAITDRERAAVSMIPKQVWADAVDADGGHRDGAGLAEITGLLPPAALAGYPDGTRVIVRRERPHPGARLDLMETRAAEAHPGPPGGAVGVNNVPETQGPATCSLPGQSAT